MSGVLGSVLPSAVSHVALSCATTSSGQTVCSDVSAGFFAGLGVLLFVYLAIVVLAIVATVKVITKAGYSGWWVLIGLVPIVGSIFFLVFAFSTWPVTREVEMLRAEVARFGRHRPSGDYGSTRFGEPRFGAIPPGPTGPIATTGTNPEAVSMPSFRQFIQRGAIPTATSSPSLPTSPPAGWYPSPNGPQGQLRFWDGSSWSDHYR